MTFLKNLSLEELEEAMVDGIRQKTSRKKRTEDFSAIRRLTGSGSIYRFFTLGDKHTEQKRSPEGVPGGHNPPTPWCLGPTRGRFLEVSLFPKNLNIPELIKNIFADFSESVYLLYHVRPYFHDSGVFRKDSFMSSSGVKVWIILLSTLMGVPEI